MFIEGKLNRDGVKIRLGGITISLDGERTRELFRSIWKCGGYYIYRIGYQFSIYVDDECIFKSLEEVLGYKPPRGYN